MKRLLILALALGLTACGDRSGAPQAASQRAAEITKGAVDASKLTPGANVTLSTYDAKGCKDKAKAQALIAASKLEDKSQMLKLYGDGMKDQSCRGFAQGLAVAVDQKDGDMACIRPGDDPENKQCFWIAVAAM